MEAYAPDSSGVGWPPVLPELELAPRRRAVGMLAALERRPADNCLTTPVATTATPDATSATLDATFATRLSAFLVVEVAFLAVERRLDVLRPARAFALALCEAARAPRFFFAVRACDFVADPEGRLADFRLPLFFFDPLLRAAM